MSNVFFTSDWHWGHKNVVKWQQCFSSEEERRTCIKDNYQSVVTKRDTVYFHGDICFRRDLLEELKALNGSKVLVLGNHDTDSKQRPSLQELLTVFKSIHSLISYKGIWLSHAPIHPEELRGKVNVHGHTHSHCVDDIRFMNICVEQNDYKPFTISDIKNTFQERGINILPQLNS